MKSNLPRAGAGRPDRDRAVCGQTGRAGSGSPIEENVQHLLSNGRTHRLQESWRGSSLDRLCQSSTSCSTTTPQGLSARGRASRSLQQMTWGLVVVCSLRSVAGLVLGYRLAHGLRTPSTNSSFAFRGLDCWAGTSLVELQRLDDPIGSGDDFRRVEDVVPSFSRRSGRSAAPERWRLSTTGRRAGTRSVTHSPLRSYSSRQPEGPHFRRAAEEDSP